jgi:hypothetical protein
MDKQVKAKVVASPGGGTLPWIKFFLISNPHFGRTPEPVVPPTYEEWDKLRSIEPSKIAASYEVFAQQVVKRLTAHRKELSEAEFLADRIYLLGNKTEDLQQIWETECRADFVRWIAEENG